jgi:SAM-dependent methyltransferase
MAEPTMIMRHSVSLYSSIAFFVGTQLDVFTILDREPMTPDEVAEALETKLHFAERLLNALVAAEVVEVEGGKFSNTSESRNFLVKGKPGYLGEHVLVNPYLKYWMFEAGIKTAESIRKGEAVDTFDYEGLPFDTLLSTFRGTMPVAVKAGEALAERFDFRDYAHVADVGGSSGGLAASLAKAYPSVSYTVTDRPSVVPVAKTLLKEQGMTEIDVVEWNLLEGPFDRKFDAVILRALIQVLSPEQAQEALRNISASVNDGGSIFILGHILDDSRTSPVEEVGWYLINLNWEDEAGYYAEEDYRRMLEESDFTGIKRETLPNGDGLIHAIKKVKSEGSASSSIQKGT